MATQKTLFFAEDGTPFEDEAAADAHDMVCSLEQGMVEFAAYHAQMVGKGDRFAARLVDLLGEYELSKVNGVPEVPQEVLDANARAVAQRKAKREAHAAKKAT